jgi:hypothetical protein
MKKYLLVIAILCSTVLARPVHAAGTFQLISPTTLPSAYTNVPYTATINFIYSGSYTPGVSLVSGMLPGGLFLGSVNQGANGVDSVTLSGTPTLSGGYPIILVLTDNNGALLTENYNLTVIYGGSFTLTSSSTLPEGSTAAPYFGSLNLDYTGSFIPNGTFSGLPSGISASNVKVLGASTDSETGVVTTKCSIQFSGTPLASGNYNITLDLWDGGGATTTFPLQLQVIGTASSNPLPVISPAQPSTPTPVSGTDSVGTNILTPDGTVSMIASDGTRRPYTSAGAFLSYGFNSWSGVVTASAADITLPIGSFIPPRDGKIICSNKGLDIGTCYLITNGQKAGFTSATVFKGLGFSFSNTTAGDVSWMTSASPVSNSTSTHLPGTLINNSGTYELVTTNGFIGIPDAATLQSWGYAFSDAVMANTTDKQISQNSVLSTKQAGQLLP